jgi:hypothetical protein
VRNDLVNFTAEAYRDGGAKAGFSALGARGTAAAPGFNLNNESVYFCNVQPWNGTNFNTVTAQFLANSREAHSATNLGTGWRFRGTPNASTTMQDLMDVDAVTSGCRVNMIGVNSVLRMNGLDVLGEAGAWHAFPAAPTGTPPNNSLYVSGGVLIFKDGSGTENEVAFI